MHSPPFDIGIATRNGLGVLRTNFSVEAAKKSAKHNNFNSLSNGSLMRCTPMVVFSSGIPYYNNQNFDEASFNNLYDLIKSEVEFTHPNIIVIKAVLIYTIAIHFLINAPSN